MDILGLHHLIGTIQFFLHYASANPGFQHLSEVQDFQEEDDKHLGQYGSYYKNNHEEHNHHSEKDSQ
jgi:hypothetical protein